MIVIILYLLSSTDFLEVLAERLSMTGKEITDSARMQNFKRNGANIGVCFAFICVGAIHLPNTIMTRPHVVFWRALQAAFILYSMFMTYLLLLPIDQAR